MSKQTEALKLALEALDIGSGHPAPWWVQEKQSTAITTIREALAEQPAQQGWKLVPVEPTEEMFLAEVAAELRRLYETNQELLAALQRINETDPCRCPEGDKIGDCDFCQARAAIAKATGEQK